MNFEETEKELSRKEIESFEKEFNVQFPESFINHYLDNNGGYPPFEYVKGIRNVFSINSFIPFKYGRVPIEVTIKDYLKSGINLRKNIPFAYDNGGNLFMICLDQNRYGKIVIAEVQFLKDSIDKYIEVANSFSDFLNAFSNER